MDKTYINILIDEIEFIKEHAISLDETIPNDFTLFGLSVAALNVIRNLDYWPV